jgi:hypothetical protein
MDDETPALAGAGVALVPVAVLLAPYLLLPAAETSGLGTYYGSGPLGGVFVPLVATLGLVTAIAFVGVYRGQSDPSLAAGTGVGLGIVGSVLVGQWALGVDPAVVASIGTATWLGWHRWLLLAATVAITAASYGFYRRVVA